MTFCHQCRHHECLIYPPHPNGPSPVLTLEILAERVMCAVLLSMQNAYPRPTEIDYCRARESVLIILRQTVYLKGKEQKID